MPSSHCDGGERHTRPKYCRERSSALTCAYMPVMAILACPSVFRTKVHRLYLPSQAVSAQRYTTRRQANREDVRTAIDVDTRMAPAADFRSALPTVATDHAPRRRRRFHARDNVTKIGSKLRALGSTGRRRTIATLAGSISRARRRSNGNWCLKCWSNINDHEVRPRIDRGHHSSRGASHPRSRRCLRPGQT